jgi:hypothetical protein
MPLNDASARRQANAMPSGSVDYIGGYSTADGVRSIEAFEKNSEDWFTRIPSEAPSFWQAFVAFALLRYIGTSRKPARAPLIGNGALL